MFYKWFWLLALSAGLGGQASQGSVETHSLPVADHDYLDDYFDKVVSNFNQQLDDVGGISSLQLNNTVLAFNRTISGERVTGTVTYTNGILLDVGPLEAHKEGHRGYPEDDGIHLFYQINFPNITMFSEVAVDLSPTGSDSGTAELLFLNTSIAVYIGKNYTLGTTAVNSAPYSTMGPATNFLPLSAPMDAAAYLARLELGYGLLWPHVSMWCSQTFNKMLTEAVDQVPFPMFPPSVQ